MTLLSTTQPATTSPLTDKCPWCGGIISRAKFLEIEARIREQERKRSQETEARLNEKFQHDLKAQKQATEKQASAEADKRIASVTTERDNAIKKAQQAEAREAALRKQAQVEAEQKVKNALEKAERERQKELQNQRQILDKDHNQVLLKQQAEFNRQREAQQKKLRELEQQLQRKTAHDIGEGAEVDVFDALRDAFQGDLINRIPKVDGGADIMHQVLYKGGVCGRILYDSKNRQVWRDSYVAKLRADQVTARAEHAILPTAVFPSGKKELSVDSGVILVNPARVVQIVTLLRDAMIRMHVRGLSMEERTSKMAQLYKYITSDAHMKRFQEAARLTDDILDVDVQEKKAHDNVWKKCGSLVVRFKNILREDDVDISAIIERRDGPETPEDKTRP